VKTQSVRNVLININVISSKKTDFEGMWKMNGLISIDSPLG